MRGTKTTEPTFGLPALWISTSRKDEAKAKGYFIVSHEKLIRTLLFEEIKKNLTEVITTQSEKPKYENYENIDWLVEKCRIAIAPYIISPLMREGKLKWNQSDNT